MRVRLDPGAIRRASSRERSLARAAKQASEIEGRIESALLDEERPAGDLADAEQYVLTMK